MLVEFNYQCLSYLCLVTEMRTYHHVPLCIVCDCYSMAYLSVLYQACGFFLISFWHVFSSVFRDSGGRQHTESEVQNLPVCAYGRVGKFLKVSDLFSPSAEENFPPYGEIFYFDGRFCTSVINMIVFNTVEIIYLERLIR
jgi:hypothetical protein